MKDYEPKDIESKWQKIWEEQKLFEAKDDSAKPKFYALMEFPYPSGEGLHTGHVRGYTAMDIIARKKRMEGFEVMYPIGWDAFGLPTENYAIKTGIQPQIITKKNTDYYTEQFKRLGVSLDWSREINTSDPKYYRWTQWLFLKFLEHDLAYKAKMYINWCPKDKIGLANEEVINGCCERCGTPVEKREKEQWMLRITKYAERLDKDLDDVDYPERVKLSQRNWIGKSEGAVINFRVEPHDLPVFTTRPDTIFGVTFIAVSPELAKTWLDIGWPATQEIKDYIATELKERAKGGFEEKEKTGIATDFTAINPATKEAVPVWITNYVLADVGTGALMGVPAHDERDWEFAKKYYLPIREVIIPKTVDRNDPPREDKKTVFRKAIQAIVIDPKNQKVLCLRWKKFPWTTFVTGGIEGDEDAVAAAQREILEETGYKNVRYVKALGGPIESHFFANHKDENRKALFSGFVFELENEEREEMSEEEKAIHEVHWLTWDEIAKDKNTKCSEYEIYLDRFFNEPHPWIEEGILINSGQFDGLESEKAKDEIIKFVGGEKKTTFKLRDWIFSRQRYWGEPIPVIHCEKCGIVPVPEKDLPVILPEIDKYEPTDNGESPLANISDWVNVKCPTCGGSAMRETDTMPNWAGSSWYFLRYVDPKNDEAFASKDKLKHWMSVDWYNGGMAHTTLHLLYSRFWNKFFFDIGLVPTSEPYKKRTSHGLLLAEGGVKMSKSLGNVINPDTIVDRFGADTLRLYEMFMGPFEQAIAWSEDALVGPRRFIEKIWKIAAKNPSLTKSTESFATGQTLLDNDSSSLLNQTIKKVTEDIESMGFNTAISTLMIFVNHLEKKENVSTEEFETLLTLLAPFAPHVTEELWHSLGHDTSIHLENWPTFDPSKLQASEVTITISINGKYRASFIAPAGTSKEELEKTALGEPEIKKWIGDTGVKKVIVVPNKIVNIVTTSLN